MITVDPYAETTFFGWFSVFFSRLLSFDIADPVLDEIQCCVMGLFALSASVLGVFLVLKRLTMMTNALSHSMLLGIVVALLLNSHWGEASIIAPPIWAMAMGAVAVGVLTAFLTEQLTRVRLIKEDASLGIVVAALFALGVTVLSLWTRNANVGPELLMGEVDMLDVSDILLVCVSAVVTVFIGILLLRPLAVAIFDPTFALMSRFYPSLLIHLLLIQVALTSIAAFRAVGFVMTVAFFVIPPLIARLFVHSVRSLLLLSAIIGVGTVFLAVALGRHLFTVYSLPLSTSALAAVLLALLYLFLLGLTECRTCKCSLAARSFKKTVAK